MTLPQTWDQLDRNLALLETEVCAALEAALRAAKALDKAGRGATPKTARDFDPSLLPPGIFSGDPQIVVRGPQGFFGNNRGSG